MVSQGLDQGIKTDVLRWKIAMLRTECLMVCTSETWTFFSVVHNSIVVDMYAVREKMED